MTHPVEFENVHRAFDERRVLRGLTLRVPQGSVYALLGRNGAGKTTAIRVALGLLEPMAGRSSLLGVDSRSIDGAVRDRIGFVSEGHKMEELRTVDRTLQYEQATRGRFDRGYADAWIQRLGLSKGARVSMLSRGQRAQLGLVLALAGRPELLLFDDPALGLDVVMRRELIDVLIDLLADGEATVLMTTHVFSDVERLADHIGILEDGALIVNTPREELRRRVRRCFVKGDSESLPELAGMLGCRSTLEGHELLLLDPDETDLRVAFGDRMSELCVPSLEELFIALTTRRQGSDVHRIRSAAEKRGAGMSRYYRLALREIAPAAIVVGGVSLVTLLFADFTRNFVLPDGDLGKGMLLLWSACGFLFGLLAAVWDDVRGTRDYAAHRDVSLGRQMVLHHGAALPAIAPRRHRRAAARRGRAEELPRSQRAAARRLTPRGGGHARHDRARRIRRRLLDRQPADPGRRADRRRARRLGRAVHRQRLPVAGGAGPGRGREGALHRLPARGRGGVPDRGSARRACGSRRRPAVADRLVDAPLRPRERHPRRRGEQLGAGVPAASPDVAVRELPVRGRAAGGRRPRASRSSVALTA